MTQLTERQLCERCVCSKEKKNELICITASSYINIIKATIVESFHLQIICLKIGDPKSN